MLPTVRIESRYPLERRPYLLPWEQGLLLTFIERLEPKRMIGFGVQEGRTAKAILRWIESIEYYLGVDVPPNATLPLSSQQPEVPQEAGHMAKADPRFQLILRHSEWDDFDIIRN